MKIKEKIALKILLFCARMCIGYGFNKELETAYKEINDLLNAEDKEEKD